MQSTLWIEFRRRYLRVQAKVFVHYARLSTVISYLHMLTFIVGRSSSSTCSRNVAAHSTPLFGIREETLIELVCHCVVNVVAQMLCKSYFEHEDHELLHFLDLLIKVLLGYRIGQHLQVFFRL